MVTVSLLGAAAFLCVLIGIPLGVWFGKSQRAYNAALPVLDFMQTMPAFVYLIPIIAFFGTGKPPGVLATLVFGTGPGDAGGPRDPVLRDGHRPHRAGALQALDRAPPARAVARPSTIPESRPRPG